MHYKCHKISSVTMPCYNVTSRRANFITQVVNDVPVNDGWQGTVGVEEGDDEGDGAGEEGGEAHDEYVGGCGVALGAGREVRAVAGGYMWECAVYKRLVAGRYTRELTTWAGWCTLGYEQRCTLGYGVLRCRLELRTGAL